MSASDQSFAGPVPEIYERLLVPLIFTSYAQDLVNRLKQRSLSQVLEIAAGTGVVTRRLAAELNNSTHIIATDLNQAMLDQAMAIGISREVEWRQADAMKLPFPDAAFDAVVCQFGAMFFPDKAKAFAEVRRVLKPGGMFVFNVWDRIEENEFAHTITMALAALFPQNPPRFLASIPHGYYDRKKIEQDLADAGFARPPQIETVTARSRTESAEMAAIGYCQGTPLRHEIEARGADRLVEASEFAAQAIAARFGPHAVDGKIQALVITVQG
jgi:ubiquinone/menaquinone biosynthesis C-methylase UbiE